MNTRSHTSPHMSITKHQNNLPQNYSYAHNNLFIPGLLALGLCGVFCTPVAAMQNTGRLALRAARPLIILVGSGWLVDTVWNDGKKTRKTIDTMSEKLSTLYETGTNKLETLIGKTHDDTVTLLKKQHQENQRRLKKLQEQNTAQQQKMAELIAGQRRVEETLAQQSQEIEKQKTPIQKIGTTIFRPGQESAE